jgi:hypothetical protein
MMGLVRVKRRVDVWWRKLVVVGGSVALAIASLGVTPSVGHLVEIVAV